MKPTFTSHAQNLEDVMLWRALRHIEHGFWIDVGAHHPRHGSVTKAFSERGWRGINIEPNPALHAALVADRPADINLSIAVGDAPGRLTLAIARNAGLSTADPIQTAKLRDAGQLRSTVQVEQRTLAEVWATHVPPDQAVHFLKVDVEGFEAAVIAGADWHRQRPWVAVIEATEPMTERASFKAWEPDLLGADYRLGYEDGLNRFYVAAEHEELLPAFRYPPNVFDAWEPATTADERGRAERAEAELQRLKSSRSWQVTRPLRRLGRLIRRP